ncbi:hypothetical protein RLEG3_18460 [Rhizobium leguminosarum bv. trifolii WSM1689]|uniref:hypothetical protein n=1 Tax=Rhizobium leguminosarum TaxID=384 RepID=UPI0003E0A779|nr:hypothetical protein [Rhizobium leguminosarum]AHF83686.1 hypothetical protein RLEG3_18460 [Rhizobium leguminosarum bv. trifolii WSM1689]
MLLKMTAGLSGPEFNLAPGDEHEFDDAEAERLVDAGFAVKADADDAPVASPARKKGKANVVSASGDAGAE